MQLRQCQKGAHTRHHRPPNAPAVLRPRATSRQSEAASNRLGDQWHVQLLARWAVTQRATHATLLGYFLAGIPPCIRQQQREQALGLWGQLYVDVFYEGDSARCAEDNAFYVDGTALVARDFGRKGHLLLRLQGEQRSDAEASSSGEAAVREQLQQDAWSLLFFSMLAMNTFPFTPAVIGWLLQHAPWLPRRWLLPSQFEQRRLDGLRRARAMGSSTEAVPRTVIGEGELK